MLDSKISSIELEALKKEVGTRILTFTRDKITGSVSVKELTDYMERNNFTKLDAVVHNFEYDDVKLACFRLPNDSYVEIDKIPAVNKGSADFSADSGMPKPMGI